MLRRTLQYSSKHLTLAWQHEIVGNNYNAEVGYVPRKDYVKINPVASYLFFPKNYGTVLSHGPKLSSTQYYNGALKHTDEETFLIYTLNFRKQSIFDTWVAHDYVKLQQAFDPTNSNKDTLPTGSEHSWKAYGFDYFSKPQQLLTYNISGRFGGYYADGTRLSISTDIGYRIQPYASITLSTSYNHIKMPQPWNSTDFWLIGPRIDVTFTNKLFFTTFVQYNNQQKNINLNTRFQWRYKPASDLFIVYTDNYYPSPFSVRNRAFVLKFTFWWNS